MAKTVTPYTYAGPAPGRITQDTMFRAPKIQLGREQVALPQGADLTQYGRVGGPMQGQHMFFRPQGVAPVETRPQDQAPAAPEGNPAVDGMSMFAKNLGQAARDDTGIRILGKDDGFSGRARDAIMGLFGVRRDPVKDASKQADKWLKKAQKDNPIAIRPMDVQGMFKG